MADPMAVPHRPCPTCPYREDCPSGIWTEAEYDKLPAYDDQPDGSASTETALFLCHQTTATGVETACRGWLSVASESIAVRFGMMFGRFTADEVYADPPVPLHSTGAEAAEAGKADLEAPGDEARGAVRRLTRKGIGVDL